MLVQISNKDVIQKDEVVDLYRANRWSAAKKPDQLLAALRNSDTLVTARVDEKLVGIGNAISDGHMVVYYPHMLVDPEYYRHRIGQQMMKVLQEKYRNFHQQTLIAETDAVEFYLAQGFELAGQTIPMWIYQGDEH